MGGVEDVEPWRGEGAGEPRVTRGLWPRNRNTVLRSWSTAARLVQLLSKEVQRATWRVERRFGKGCFGRRARTITVHGSACVVSHIGVIGEEVEMVGCCVAVATRWVDAPGDGTLTGLGAVAEIRKRHHNQVAANRLALRGIDPMTNPRRCHSAHAKC